MTESLEQPAVDRTDPRSPLYRSTLPAGTRSSGKAPFWEPGTQIWWRYAHRTIHPMTVVRDDADGLVAWLAGETPITKSAREVDGSDPRSSFDDMFTAPRMTIESTWKGSGTLRIAPTGEPWSIWLFWKPDGKFANWYVNLEDTHVRDAHGIYTRDRVLDLVVRPDGGVKWKDVDELLLAVENGRETPDEAAGYHADARRVVEIVERWGSPFCDGWERWRPDPALSIPALPAPDARDFTRGR